MKGRKIGAARLPGLAGRAAESLPGVVVTGGGGGGGGDAPVPTDWVEYFIDTPPQGPYAYNVTARTVEWADDSFSHGGAIVLNAGQPEVTEDGWYAIDTYVLVEAVTVATIWTRALGILEVNRSFAIGGDTQDNVFLSQVFGPYVDNAGAAGGNASFSWTGYLLAGDSVHVRALLSADSAPGDTWRIAEAQFRMEKLPMTGPAGPAGADGAGGGTTWLHGSGVPDDGDGSDGDFYLDDDTDDVYVKVAGTWA